MGKTTDAHIGKITQLLEEVGYRANSADAVVTTMLNLNQEEAGFTAKLQKMNEIFKKRCDEAYHFLEASRKAVREFDAFTQEKAKRFNPLEKKSLGDALKFIQAANVVIGDLHAVYIHKLNTHKRIAERVRILQQAH